MKHRKLKVKGQIQNICGVISLICFIGLLGVAGASDQDLITLGETIRNGAGFLVGMCLFAWLGGLMD